MVTKVAREGYQPASTPTFIPNGEIMYALRRVSEIALFDPRR
jgi:hypothetical protein